jgi:uncharacterized membrane protein YccF (DUF307 family)
MKLLLNILWFIFGGWISGTLWLLAGVILAITVIGLPWTPSAFRIAAYSYFPFGKDIEHRWVGGGVARETTGLLLNIIWIVFAGWWLALHHLALAVALAITIIGLPFAWAHLKLAVVSLAPVGATIIERP